jgi:DNA-directed RNA polymerase subunit H (RpoH/RPB5)
VDLVKQVSELEARHLLHEVGFLIHQLPKIKDVVDDDLHKVGRILNLAQILLNF